jgi:S-adenosylmethionine:tRNA-ribosyltransferase-isomerase (queuine synthetase)
MDTIRNAYAEAIRRRYLFYSYGDSMFIRRAAEQLHNQKGAR